MWGVKAWWVPGSFLLGVAVAVAEEAEVSGIA